MALIKRRQALHLTDRLTCTDCSVLNAMRSEGGEAGGGWNDSQTFCIGLSTPLIHHGILFKAHEG